MVVCPRVPATGCAPTQSNERGISICCPLSALRFPRQRQSGQLTLSNVTLVVPDPELQLLLGLVAPGSGPPGWGGAAPSSLVQLLNATWGGGTVSHAGSMGVPSLFLCFVVLPAINPACVEACWFSLCVAGYDVG